MKRKKSLFNSTKLQKVKNTKEKKKEPHLQDQHLLLLFPIKFEQFVHIHFEQQYKEELFHPLLHFKKKKKKKEKNKRMKKRKKKREKKNK